MTDKPNYIAKPTIMANAGTPDAAPSSGHSGTKKIRRKYGKREEKSISVKDSTHRKGIKSRPKEEQFLCS